MKGTSRPHHKGIGEKSEERWRRNVGESTEGAHTNAEGAVASVGLYAGMGFTFAGSASGKLRRKSASKNTIKGGEQKEEG